MCKSEHLELEIFDDFVFPDGLAAEWAVGDAIGTFVAEAEMFATHEHGVDVVGETNGARVPDFCLTYFYALSFYGIVEFVNCGLHGLENCLGLLFFRGGDFLAHGFQVAGEERHGVGEICDVTQRDARVTWTFFRRFFRRARRARRARGRTLALVIGIGGSRGAMHGVIFGVAEQSHPKFGDYDRGSDWRRVCISKLLGDLDYE